MGTNYYVESKKCPHCGHHPEWLHIGKSSAGWTFSFHATEEIRSWKQWQEFLKDKQIVDEDGTGVSLEELVEIVESKKDAKFNHTIEMRRDPPYPHYDSGCFLDSEGHSFSEYDFS